MADKNSSKNNFIMQAGILAAAGIISRIIGLLYRGPLQSVIGNLGLGYYQSAYNYYTIILLISSYSIPSAISKAIAQKLGEKEYRNAHRLFHGAMIYVLVVGGIASLFLFFGAGLFVSGAAVTVLRTFAPTIYGNDGGPGGSGRAGDESNLRCRGKCTGYRRRRISGVAFYGGSLCSESWNDPAQSAA